jgi:hypothetical protein
MDLVIVVLIIDNVFWPESTNQEVFTSIAQPLIISAMEGYNGIPLLFIHSKCILLRSNW